MLTLTEHYFRVVSDYRKTRNPKMLEALEALVTIPNCPPKLRFRVQKELSSNMGLGGVETYDIG